MNKMMKTVGGMIALGAAGYGMYMIMNQKMPKTQMKKTIKSPYTMDTNANVKSN